MKKIAFLACIVMSCNSSTSNSHPVCLDYHIEIIGLNEEIDKQFQEIGRLKERLEQADEYISLLEWENDTLNKLYAKSITD